MKNIVIFFILAATLFSCNNDDNIVKASSDEPIVGNWQLLKRERSGFAGPEIDDYSKEEVFYNFKNNKTVVVSSNLNAISEGTYSYTFADEYLVDEPTSKDELYKIVTVKNTKYIFKQDDEDEDLIELKDSNSSGYTLFFERSDKK